MQQAAGNGTATAITLSFRGTTPLPMEYNPKKVFNALFGFAFPGIFEAVGTDAVAGRALKLSPSRRMLPA